MGYFILVFHLYYHRKLFSSLQDIKKEYKKNLFFLNGILGVLVLQLKPIWILCLVFNFYTICSNITILIEFKVCSSRKYMFPVSIPHYFETLLFSLTYHRKLEEQQTTWLKNRNICYSLANNVNYFCIINFINLFKTRINKYI